MRFPAVPPAIALVFGAALGVTGQAAPGALAAALVLGATLSLLAWHQRVDAAFTAAVLFTYAVCGYRWPSRRRSTPSTHS